jgi:hypothetical protein
MIRVLIIVTNLLLALLMNLLSGSPTAVISAPSNVTAGQPFLVEVTINPDGSNGFMRYSMELPDGWTAQKADADGADFYFEKNAANDHYSAKFLWSQVGDRQVLKVTFYVTPAANASGNFQLGSKLTQMVDNLPEDIILDAVTVRVTGAGGNAGGNNIDSNPDSTAKPSVAVSITRTVPSEPVEKEFLVDVIINKDDLSSFGKFEDSLPAVFTATAVMTDGADFSFENGVARFYWYVLPKKQVLHVQYKVTIAPEAKGEQKFYGHFSYIEGENGKIARANNSSVTIVEPPPLALQDNSAGNNVSGTQENTGGTAGGTEETGQGNNTGAIARETNSENAQSNAGGTQQQNGGAQQQNVKAVVTTTAGVKFSVQIAAMRRMVPASYFGNLWGIREPIDMAQVEGLNKYTTGIFTGYKEARDHRESLKSKGVPGAFVAAFNSGKRITVQEALMITSQKWLP